LALAVGYPDLFSVSQTILNQSGAELQVFLMLMATYLSFSLATSAFTNWYNRRMSLRER
jgi:general L-amino acid transport system permease protein